MLDKLIIKILDRRNDQQAAGDLVMELSFTCNLESIYVQTRYNQDDVELLCDLSNIYAVFWACGSNPTSLMAGRKCSSTLQIEETF